MIMKLIHNFVNILLSLTFTRTRPITRLMNKEHVCCGLCAKFRPNKAPINVEDPSRLALWNEDGTERTNLSRDELTTTVLAVISGQSYGQRNCSFGGVASSESPCKSPDEFEERKS